MWKIVAADAPAVKYQNINLLAINNLREFISWTTENYLQKLP
jgi:hypothetical protein